MRICFVVHTFDKRDRGGVLRVISQLANQLVNYYDVDILSFGCVDEQAYKIDRRIKLISLNMMNYNTSYYNGLKKLTGLERLSIVFIENCQMIRFGLPRHLRYHYYFHF